MSKFCTKAIIPAILAVLSFGLTLLSTLYCQYVTVSWSTTDEGGDGDGGEFTQNFGIWNYQGPVYSERSGNVYLTCLPYKNSSFNPFPVDARWRTAMAFSVIASVLGGVLATWVFLAPCCSPAKAIWKPMAHSCWSFALFQGLTLFFLSSSVCQAGVTSTVEGQGITSNGCTRFVGANSAIASIVFWAVTGLSMLRIDPPEMPPAEVQHQTVTYTETVQPDGTRVVNEQTTVVKGTVVNPPQPVEEA